jgi:hypothetical protein
MSDEENLTRHAPLSLSAVGGRFAVIGGVLFTSALAFAYAGGWLTPDRLTPTRIVAALSDRGGNPLGHRRNHSKGMCFTGVFDANGAGSRYSVAPMLVAGRYPVVGRFAKSMQGGKGGLNLWVIMAGTASPHGPSYRAHPRLYRLGIALIARLIQVTGVKRT